ncbi:MAG: DNA replication/repair protein RecF [Oscillospiraceae bacterium]|nr:DNA replication/repair protein RecF [Oscillospiraceae bacterium]
MRADSITLEGFRNYALSSCSFGGGVNVIVGDNAQGKTNLLEALYLGATGRSFRTRTDKELIGFDRDFALISLRGFSYERERKTEITLRRGGRRTMVSNGVKLKTAAELSESFSAVLFCPEDLGLIREGAAVRRKLMDGCLCQLWPRYAQCLSLFNRAYEQKTRILRDWEENPELLDLLPEYDVQMARYSAELIRYRGAYAKRLAEEARRIHAEFSTGEELGCTYRTVKTVTDTSADVETIYNQVLEHTRSHSQAERASGLCLSGAHKDDLEITVNGQDARAYASQGQCRTAALSLKLAEREIHFTRRGEYPILLLDDVLSELDPARQSFILNRVMGGQVFITCCEDAGLIAERTGGRIITVRAGAMEAQE